MQHHHHHHEGGYPNEGGYPPNHNFAPPPYDNQYGPPQPPYNPYGPPQPSYDQYGPPNGQYPGENWGPRHHEHEEHRHHPPRHHEEEEGGHWGPKPINPDHGDERTVAPSSPQTPTHLHINLNQSRGADVHKCYLKIKYSGRECRCGTVKTNNNQVAEYMETKEFTLDDESIEIILMEDNFGIDHELAAGQLNINTSIPNDWSGWMKMESKHRKARDPEVLIEVRVK